MHFDGWIRNELNIIILSINLYNGGFEGEGFLSKIILLHR